MMPDPRSFDKPFGPFLARFTRSLLVVVVSVLIGTRLPARAASVAPMDVETLADLAGQVIAGTVGSADSQWAADPRRIETTITLQSVEYLKGPAFDASGRFSFVVPGGTVGRTSMQIGCAPTFQLGERWLLFLLPTYRTYPVVGVYRGCFRVLRESGGAARVYDHSFQPLLGLDNEGRIVIDASSDPRNRIQAVEGGVRVSNTATSQRSRGAITYEAFRAMLMPILAQSKDYHLSHPAGRRESTQFTAMPLQVAGNPSSRTSAGARANAQHHTRSQR